MKKSFKGFLACLLALIMVIPMFTVANADQMSTFNGTLQARETASVDVSRIRNSGIDMSAIPRISLPFWSNSKPLPQRRFAKISKQQAIIVSSSTLPTRPQPL